jgi:hypothetical protein
MEAEARAAGDSVYGRGGGPLWPPPNPHLAELLN